MMILAQAGDPGISTHNPAIGGMVSALGLVAALLFLRFYRRTRDPLFLLFSISFALEAIGRLVIPLVSAASSQLSEHPERLAQYYLLRVVAYALIVVAIIVKNRNRPPRLPPRPH